MANTDLFDVSESDLNWIDVVVSECGYNRGEVVQILRDVRNISVLSLESSNQVIPATWYYIK